MYVDQIMGLLRSGFTLPGRLRVDSNVNDKCKFIKIQII